MFQVLHILVDEWILFFQDQCKSFPIQSVFLPLFRLKLFRRLFLADLLIANFFLGVWLTRFHDHFILFLNSSISTVIVEIVCIHIFNHFSFYRFK